MLTHSQSVKLIQEFSRIQIEHQVRNSDRRGLLEVKEEVIRRFIDQFTRESDLVLDRWISGVIEDENIDLPEPERPRSEYSRGSNQERQEKNRQKKSLGGKSKRSTSK